MGRGFFSAIAESGFSASLFMSGMDLRIIRTSKNSMSRLKRMAGENHLYFTPTQRGVGNGERGILRLGSICLRHLGEASTSVERLHENIHHLWIKVRS
jgi:hypothetical protein